MLRTALTALALSLALAACVSQHPQTAGVAGNQHDAQNSSALNPPCADCTPPDAIMCAAPGAPHGWIAVPPGKKPADVCPENFIRDRLVHLPVFNDAKSRYEAKPRGEPFTEAPVAPREGASLENGSPTTGHPP